MNETGEFPLLSSTVKEMSAVSPDANDSNEVLSDMIMKDISLSRKVLAVANSAQYSRGGSEVSTISRAIVRLGFDTVKDIALSMVLLDALGSKNANLKQSLTIAWLAGKMAKQLCLKARAGDAEETALCSMFSRLGHVLAEFYFPDKYQVVSASPFELQDRTFLASFGLTITDFGAAIAEYWGLPSKVKHCISNYAGKNSKIRVPQNHLEWLSSCANFSSLLATHAISDHSEIDLNTLVSNYSGAFKLNAGDIKDIVEKSAKEAREFMANIKIKMDTKSVNIQEIKDDDPINNLEVPISEGGEKTVDILLEGINSITAALMESPTKAEVGHLMKDSMARAFKFDGFCMFYADAKGSTLVPHGTADLSRFGGIPLQFSPDVFHLAISKNMDVLIENPESHEMAQRIPAWFKTLFKHKSFILFPIIKNDKPIALMYGGWKTHISQKDLDPEFLKVAKSLKNTIKLASF